MPSLNRARKRIQSLGIVVSLEEPRKEGWKPSLDALDAIVADDINRVNRLIVEKMESRAPLIPQLAGHIVAAGGKRLRPMLTLAASRLCGYEGDRHIALATCVEFIHTATLLHDDVVDESMLRRGQESANALWGNEASVLVGDFLFSRAFQLMVSDASLKTLKILSDASAIIAEGEVLQLLTTNDTETSEEAYLEVIRSKTATLFAAAAKIGAVVAERPKAEEEALESYGMNLGIAFQLVDDALAIPPTKPRSERPSRRFPRRKISLPVVLAWRRGDDNERDFWRRTLERQATKSDLERAISLMEKHGAPAIRSNARHYGAIARDALGIFSDGETKSAMNEAIDFSVERAF